jgi:glycine cleavage system aminomethyltransferase T
LAPSSAPPEKGDKLFHEDKEAGSVTSIAPSPASNEWFALGYVRREAIRIGGELQLGGREVECSVLLVNRASTAPPSDGVGRVQRD